MNRISRVMVFVVLLALSLNEFYHEDVGRIFDYLAITVILIFFVNNFVINKGQVSNKKSELSLFIFFLPFIIAGILSSQFLPSFAVLTGVTFIALFVKYCIRKDMETFVKMIDVIIYIHLVTFFIQILAFYIFNYSFSYVDFFPGLQASRVYNPEINLLRPGGLMMEPNAYSGNLFMFVYMSYRLKRRLTPATKIALFTVPLTTSLWGIFLIIAAVFLFIKPKFTVTIAMLVVVFFSFFTNLISDNSLYIRIISILSDPTSDPSIVNRLGLESTRTSTISKVIFGNGINSVDFQEFMGGNGFSYMIFCLGIVGTFFFLLWFYVSNGWRFFILFVIFNITFPYFSYMIYWAFLAVSLKNITLKIRILPDSQLLTGVMLKPPYWSLELKTDRFQTYG